VILNVRERSRQKSLATTRDSLTLEEFVARLSGNGVDEAVAKFVWDEMQPYYFAPLTPYPSDRPIGDLRVDGDDLSDLVIAFEKTFDRKWSGKWVGPDDPTLLEFAVGLTNSTEPR